MGYIKIANLSEIREDAVKIVPVKSGRIGLILIDGKVQAFRDLCTHHDSPLDPNSLNGTLITCPRHGAVFNLKNGEVVSPPATEDLELFPVRIVGESVEIEIT